MKNAFESIAKKSAEDRNRKNILEPIIHDAKQKLQEKIMELDSVRKECSQQKSECDAIKAELSACKQALNETKQIMDEAYKKEAESREELMALTLQMEQIDTLFNQKSTEFEITKDKYKRKHEKLQVSEKRNDILTQELEKMKILRDEQVQNNAKLLENLNYEKNSGQMLKMEIDNLKTKMKVMEDNHLKQHELLEHHERDAVEKYNLLQALATDMDTLQRRNEKLVSKKERAERQAKILAEELECERK